METRRWVVTVAAAALVSATAWNAFAEPAKTMYDDVLAREQALRAASRRGADPSLRQVRDVIAAYEALVRRYPASGYSDNALYQAAMLAADSYRRLVDERDRRTTLRLLKQLLARYPASRLVRSARATLAELEPRRAAAPPPPSPDVAPPPLPSGAPLTIPSAAPIAPALAPPPVPAGHVGPGAAAFPPVMTIKDIKRVTMPEVVRVLIELEGEVPFHEERLDSPARMFVDLKGTRAVAALADAVLSYSDDAVRKIRVGRHPQNTTRVVIDLQDVERYSVFTLYNPYRIVIDCERRSGVQTRATTGQHAEIEVARTVAPAAELKPPATAEPLRVEPKPEPPPPPIPSAKPVASAPAAPAANLQGGFSLARQLGLGISRIVIDPGHGGHDPGAHGPNGVVESSLVLDVALRLEKLLLKENGVEVVMTRRTDEFIPLEERTAIANREGADLFLSIHANASRNNQARGVETYFLNFATNPEAEAVAARENMTSGRTMSSLPDMVRAIALNNKLDESRDLATLVQQAMVQRLRAPNQSLKDLGVKQAPFVVLIGAAMPSVLAEISFVTNRQEAALLKGGGYRQRIAEALFNAIVRYQRSLKNARTIAKREAQER